MTNRNRSEISHATMVRNMNSIVNCPILADVQKYVDASGQEYYDFAGHTMEPMPDPEHDGETRMNYIERVVGVIPANANIELRKEYNDSREYLHTDGLIFEEHGNLTASILRRRKEVACSVEIAVNKMHYDLERSVLVIDDFQFLGVTLLGKSVPPGMEGATAYTTFEDVAQHSDSITAALQPLVAQMERLQVTVAGIINKEGGKTMILNDLLKKYNVSLDDLTFDYKTMTDTELETAFASAFEAADGTDDTSGTEEGTEEGESGTSGGGTDPDGGEEGVGTGEDGEDPEPEPEPEPGGEDDDDPEEPEPNSLPNDDKQEQGRRSRRYQHITDRNVLSVTFEVTYTNLMQALYDALENDEKMFGWVHDVLLDTNEVIYSYFSRDNSGSHYRKRSYTFDGSSITALGDPMEVKSRFLTEEEWNMIDQMRSTYDTMRTELQGYQDREASSQKAELMASGDYALISDMPEFKALDIASFSVDELRDKLDQMLLAKVKHQTYNGQESVSYKGASSFINLFGASASASTSDFLEKLAAQSGSFRTTK